MRVLLSTDVVLAGLCHALSTEREEIMGLLLGEWTETAGGDCDANVYDLFIMPRSDRRKDRVEISPEKLARAADAAESVGKRLGRPTRVVGWYHSHPKITVQPSHVDVRTQADYQMVDPRFVGLIFAVFYRDNEQLNRVQVTAFQSVEGAKGLEQSHPQLLITPANDLTHDGPLGVLAALPDTLFDEERTTYDESLAAVLQRSPGELQQQLARMHHGAVYTKALTNVIDKLCGPILHMLDLRRGLVDREMHELTQRKEQLLEQQSLLF